MFRRYRRTSAEAFADRLRQAARVLPAEMTTAVPLGDARRAQLVQAIGKAGGYDVMIAERVDFERARVALIKAITRLQVSLRTHPGA